MNWLTSAASTPSTSFTRHIRFPTIIAAGQVTSTATTTMSEPHPSLKVTGGGRKHFLQAFKTLNRPYNPFQLICWNRHLETIFAAFFRNIPEVRLRQECLRTKDDGSVSLDWVAGDQLQLPPESPLLILLPGLTGGSQDSYVRHMIIRARSEGWRVVVFNSRGCGYGPVTTPQLIDLEIDLLASKRVEYVRNMGDNSRRFYSASFLGDMYEVVEHVSMRYPQANLYAVGWSLGANILVRYMGQESHACPLSGAVSLCNPFNLVMADENFHKGFNNVYDKALANSLRKIFKRHALLFEDIGGEFDIPMVANAKSVREFDEGLTRVSFGFKSVDEYYSNSSSSDSIKSVCKPLLCIQAENDPIAPAGGIPYEDIEENENCILIVTPKGGHLGWVAGPDAPLGCPWTDPVVMDFLEHLKRGVSTTVPSCSDSNPVEHKIDV